MVIQVQEHEEAMSCCEKEHNITREALQVSQNNESELKCSLESTKQSYEDKIQEIIKEVSFLRLSLENCYVFAQY